MAQSDLHATRSSQYGRTSPRSARIPRSEHRRVGRENDEFRPIDQAQAPIESLLEGRNHLEPLRREPAVRHSQTQLAAR